jgi:hypothetical protein
MRSEEAFLTIMGNNAGAGSLAAGERVKAKSELKRPMMKPFRCSEALEMGGMKTGNTREGHRDAILMETYQHRVM